MSTSKDFSETEIRNIVRDELSHLMPEFEILKENDLSSKEKLLCKEAEIEYKKGKTLSFEEVYEKVMKN